MPSQQRLIVFTRFPQPGHVKTRLAPALGLESSAWGLALARQEPLAL